MRPAPSATGDHFDRRAVAGAAGAMSYHRRRDSTSHTMANDLAPWVRSGPHTFSAPSSLSDFRGAGRQRRRVQWGVAPGSPSR